MRPKLRWSHCGGSAFFCLQTVYHASPLATKRGIRQPPVHGIVGQTGDPHLAAGRRKPPRPVGPQAEGNQTTESIIFIWRPGGPSHQDTYDMKPDAPDSFRNPYLPILKRKKFCWV